MSQDAKTARANLVLQKYTNELMRKKHVMGVGIGMEHKDGVPTGEVSLVVMVDHKVPPDMVSPEDIIPAQLDGIRVDVQEIGTPRAY